MEDKNIEVPTVDEKIPEELAKEVFPNEIVEVIDDTTLQDESIDEIDTIMEIIPDEQMEVEEVEEI